MSFLNGNLLDDRNWCENTLKSTHTKIGTRALEIGMVNGRKHAFSIALHCFCEFGLVDECNTTQGSFFFRAFAIRN